MKIPAIKGFTAGLGICATVGTLLFATPKQRIQAESLTDRFEYVDKNTIQNNSVKAKPFPLPIPEGSTDAHILATAPNPEVTIKGVKQKAVIVIDITHHTLYHYDEQGKPVCAYLIATGKKSTPTHTGIRVITGIEHYPYSKAYGTKRKKYPEDYGKRFICMEKIDTITGKQTVVDEFVHGNKNYNSLGKDASKGCMRMDNDAIIELVKKLKPKQIIKIIRR